MVSLENGNYQLELIAWWISFAVLKFVILETKLCVNEKKNFYCFWCEKRDCRCRQNRIG